MALEQRRGERCRRAPFALVLETSNVGPPVSGVVLQALLGDERRAACGQ